MGEVGQVRRVAVAVGLGAALLLAGCGKDDGAGVRSDGAASGSGAGSGSGTGSGSGLANQDLSGTTNDQQVLKAVADYKAWVAGEADGLVADTAKFTDAVRAGDLVDARVDDFEGVNDPKFTGWHRIEYILWEKGTTDGAKPFADRLDKDIASLDQQLKTLEFPPAAVALGPAELIEEVSEGKITGEEDRYSHTDLSDFNANVDGSKKLFELLTPALQAKDAALTADITAGFAAVDKSLAPYANPDGTFDSYTALKAADKTRMQAELAGLSEKLARIPGVLGLKG
jgi:iron uptake system component EfeO